MEEEMLQTTSDSDREDVNGIELTRKIIELVEFYFSDENALKDKFLLKHIKRNKEGYVSIKLMTSYRKMKALTKNWQVVAYSLKASQKLEVNEEGTRVRRKQPLPEIEESVNSRYVLAYKLPFERPTVEKVGTLFSSCGEISLVQILRPGSNIPENVRKLSNKRADILNETCALIEFENELSARKSLEVKSARVIPLNPSETKNKRKKVKSKPPKDIIENETFYSGYRSSSVSSVSSGYLSSSPRRGSDCDTRCTSPAFVTNLNSRRYTLPTVVHQDRRENRLQFISEQQKLSNYILRLPKGPDNSKGFTTRKTIIRGSI